MGAEPTREELHRRIEELEKIAAEGRRARELLRQAQNIFGIKTAEGREKWVWEEGNGVYTPDAQLEALEGFISDVTELKQAQEALHQTANLYRTLIESSLTGIYMLRKGAFVFANEMYSRIMGYSWEDLKAIDPIDVLVPEEREKIQGIFLKRLAGEAVPSEYETQMVRKDGTRIYVQVRAALIQFEGTLTVLGNIIDITERKMTERALGESEAKYRQLVDYAPAGIYEVDFVKGRFISVNDIMCQYSGFSREELLAMSPINILSEESKKVFAERVKKILAGEPVSENLEFKIVSKTGQEIWTLINSRFIREQGRIRGATVVAHNITERRRAEEALRDSEERYRALVEASSDALLLRRSDGTIIYANPAALAFLHAAKPEDLLGRDYLDFVHPEDQAESRRRIERGLRTELAVPKREHRLVALDGAVIEVESTGIPVKYQGQPHLLGIFHDISERKRAEEERRKLEGQLRHVQKLESLGVLAGGIAHDFNNLLMAILGNADLAMQYLSSSSPAWQNVQEIEKASHRAAELCRQMLAYSGKGKFVIEKLKLSEVVREMAHMLEISISKKATLRYHFAENLPAVEADPVQVRQVIMNLITNASDALSDQGGVIAIETGVLKCDREYLSRTYLDDNLPEGLYVYLEVADTGCGMDAETKQKIFDPFFSTKFAGRGLGLAAVLGIVRGHGGAIQVSSERGQGSTFRILLPAVEGVAEEEEGKESRPGWRGGGTVLLVDDEEMVRVVGKQMLENLGFQVLTAEDGHEALPVFLDHADKIICVVLDLTMRQMSGEETFDELQRLRSDVRVILTSGYTEQEVARQFSGKGLAGFIQKPYTLKSLRETLQRVLS